MAGSFSGTIPANASANTNDLFASLLEFAWREVGFPVIRFKTLLRQDLAIHKFADRDGAHVEATGRAPLQISARIPFINGLDQGPNEHWQRPLYPFAWRKFFSACADRTSGTLQHPELGPLTCKVESMETDWDAGARGGTYVEVTWIESDDSTVDLTNDLAQPSPLADAQAAASDLDFQLSTTSPLVTPQPYVPPITFTSLMQSIRSVTDQTTIVQKQSAGRIDNMIYEAQALEDSLNRAVNANCLNWPMIRAAEVAKSSAYDIKATQLTKSKPIALYTTTKDSTMAQVAAVIGTPLAEVMLLNPNYIAGPLIFKDSVVRYYKKAA